jgi:hypothetical protein
MMNYGLRAVRFRVDALRVVCDTGERFMIAAVVNVSESGVLVDADYALEVGARVNVHPDVDVEVPLPVELPAVVARVTFSPDLPGRHRLAFRFVELSDDVRSQLRDYIEGRGEPIYRA